MAAGPYMAKRAAKKASKVQAGASEQAQEMIGERFQESKALIQPFVEGSSGAFQKQQALSGAMGPEAQQEAYASYQESPGVAWAREQGMRGIEQNLGAQGIGGGSRLKAMSRFNQGLAMQDFSNQFNRLGAITGVGLGAATSLMGGGAAAAAGQAQQAESAAAARAGGILAGGQQANQMTSNAVQVGKMMYGAGG